MPTHVFQPIRNPPRWWDRLLVHPLDTTVAVIAVLFGVLVVLSLVAPDYVPSKSMDRMPWPVVILVSGFLGTGGVMALTGLNWWCDNVSPGGKSNNSAGGSQLAGPPPAPTIGFRARLRTIPAQP